MLIIYVVCIEIVREVRPVADRIVRSIATWTDS